MLSLSFALLLTAALLGSVLAALHLRTERVPPGAMFGALHGVLGVAGFVALLLSLGGPPRGAAMGIAPFGRAAAALFAMALLVAVPIVMVRRRGWRIPGVVIGAHAAIAISGVVILAAYTLLD
jgi:hypothetical protein